MPLLIPSSVPTGSWGNGSFNYIFYCRFQANLSGTLNEIQFYSGNSGNAKVGLYDDDTGPVPNTRLTYNNTGQAASSSQWNSITVPDYEIISGTYYWLAVLTGTSGVATGDSGQSWESVSQIRDYGTGLPSAATVSESVDILFSFAGYGDLPLIGGGKNVSCIGF
jgi:hypothetical protein